MTDDDQGDDLPPPVEVFAEQAAEGTTADDTPAEPTPMDHANTALQSVLTSVHSVAGSYATARAAKDPVAFNAHRRHLDRLVPMLADRLVDALMLRLHHDLEGK